MNFLYQAATFMATLSVPPPAPVKGKGGKVNSSDKEKNLSNPHGMHGKDESAQPSSSSEPTNECTGGPSDMVVDKVAPADHVDQGLLTPSERPPQRLSRRKRKAIFQKYKLELAAQQISPDPSHHRLLTRQVKQRRMKRMVQGDQTHDLPNSRPCISHEKDQQQQQQQHSSDVQSSDDQYALSGAARFFASTMREIGRKNVVRIGPSIKQTVCQRCEAVLIPAISCEVRVGGMHKPQAN
ncbi:hypothetical protein BGW38_006023 [Lunasporangiospora selenospora]|uniref:Uncharacterized protein n=1 Tax=Lunasporangiospora selenospora TaxID=979761 RepID=A0A9P6FMQ0_9FUNG|nr:hypothetical protein BGW38_006023 [Lunasporangiospora selenospora]